MNGVALYIHRGSLAAIAVSCLGASPASDADMSGAEGVEPWESCALCHGATGVTAMSRFPHLAGQKPDYLRRQLENFRSGRRSNDGGQMAATAEAVSSREIEAIVNHFSSLPAPMRRSEESLDGAAIAQGEQIFLKGSIGAPACAACHAETHSPAPWLFGQHADYLVKQMRDFAAGARAGGALQVMQRVARHLTDSEMLAVSIYLETVPECRQEVSTVVQKTLKNKAKTTCYDRQ